MVLSSLEPFECLFGYKEFDKGSYLVKMKGCVLEFVTVRRFPFERGKEMNPQWSSPTYRVEQFVQIMHARVRAHSHTRTHAHMHACTYACTCARALTHARTHTYIRGVARILRRGGGRSRHFDPSSA